MTVSPVGLPWAMSRKHALQCLGIAAIILACIICGPSPVIPFLLLGCCVAAATWIFHQLFPNCIEVGQMEVGETVFVLTSSIRTTPGGSGISRNAQAWRRCPGGRYEDHRMIMRHSLNLYSFAEIADGRISNTIMIE